MNKLEQWTIVTFMPEAIFHKNFSIIISKYNNYYRPINFKMNEVQTTEYIHISAAFPPISHSQCPLFLFEANFVYCVPVIEPVNHSHSQKVSEIVWSTAHTAIKWAQIQHNCNRPRICSFFQFYQASHPLFFTFFSFLFASSHHHRFYHNNDFVFDIYKQLPTVFFIILCRLHLLPIDFYFPHLQKILNNTNKW